MSTSPLAQPESPLDVLSRAASMVEKSGSSSDSASSKASSVETSPTQHTSSVTKTNGICERSPSFKERHPKFRKNVTPDYMMAAAEHNQARNSSRSFTSTAPTGGLQRQQSAPPLPAPRSPPTDEEGPLDMSIKKQRSESPPPPPPYKYTPLLNRRISPPPPRVLGELPFKVHNPPPPPYPSLRHSPSPPPMESFRPPPPSYESATVKCTYPSPNSVRHGLDPSKKSDVPVTAAETMTERPVREITIITDSSADPLLDEHFRRSLGADYQSLFNKKENVSDVKTESKPKIPEGSQTKPSSKEEITNKPSTVAKDPVRAFQEDMEMEGYTVEDHFAKALGDTWLKLQADKDRGDSETKMDTSNNATTTKPQVVAL